MARIPVSDDWCVRLVASRDPIDPDRLRDEAVAEVSCRLIDELLAEVARDRPSRRDAPRRRRQRRGLAVAAAAAVVIIGVLALVGWLPGGAGHDGPLNVPAASAGVVLDRAAQAAMRSTSVVPVRGQYGYVQVRTGSVIGTTTAGGLGEPRWNVWVRMSEVKSDWYTANGSGRERSVRTSTRFLTPRDRAIAQAHGTTLARLTAATFPRVLDGRFPARTLQTAGFLPYWQISDLPTEPAALRRALDRLILASTAGPARESLRRQMRADPAGLFAPIARFLYLPTSPQLRAALFRVLADLPGVQLLGHRRDRLGRTGIAVAVTDGQPNQVREELLFDPSTSNLLQTQTSRSGRAHRRRHLVRRTT